MRKIFVPIAAFFVGQFIVFNYQNWLTRHGWSDLFSDAETWLASYPDLWSAVIAFLRSPFMGGVAAASAVYLIFSLIDWLRSGRREARFTRAQKLRALGMSAMVLGDNTRGVLSVASHWREPGDTAQLVPEVYSMMLRFQAAGIIVPEVDNSWPTDRKLSVAQRYFATIGPLLRDGLTREARWTARDLAKHS